MKTSRKTYNQATGFAIVELLLIFFVLGIIGLGVWYLYHAHASLNSGGLPYKAKNFRVSLGVKEDQNFDQQVYLTTFFDDSISNDPCPQAISGFAGQMSITYVNEQVAKLSVAQSAPPKSGQPDTVFSGACPDVVVSGYSSQLKLDRKWLNSQASHDVLANGQHYSLTYDKKDYLLKWSMDQDNPRATLYPPDKVVFLFSHSSSPYSTCMSENELTDYAKQHNLTPVSRKYPDFEAAFRRAEPGVFTNNYYSPLLLVIANDSLKAVAQSMNSPREQEQCSLWVGSNLNILNIAT